MTLGIVLFDVTKLGRLPKGGMHFFIPVEPSKPIVEYGISVSKHTQIAFEMLHVYDVEADQGAVDANVDFGEVVPEEVGTSIGGGEAFEEVE